MWSFQEENGEESNIKKSRTQGYNLLQTFPHQARYANIGFWLQADTKGLMCSPLHSL